METPDKKEIVRGSVEDLLKENDINPEEDIDSQTLTFERTPSTIQQNAFIGLEQCKVKAEKIMLNLLKLYLSDGFINKSEYIQAKKNLDSMTLGKIMNQMEVSERAINVLMANLELGDVNPKLFDALGNLQRTFIELVKTQTNYIANAQNEYERIAMDKEERMEESTVDDVSSGGGIKSNNQRDLMRLIRKGSKENNN